MKSCIFILSPIGSFTSLRLVGECKREVFRPWQESSIWVEEKWVTFLDTINFVCAKYFSVAVDSGNGFSRLNGYNLRSSWTWIHQNKVRGSSDRSGKIEMKVRPKSFCLRAHKRIPERNECSHLLRSVCFFCNHILIRNRFSRIDFLRFLALIIHQCWR